MHNYLDINHICVFIGGILLVLSAVMFMIPIQHTVRWKNFRTGRNTLAIAYIVLGLLMIIDGTTNDGNRDSSGMFTLIVAFFQALLYTKICILFLKPRSIDNKQYKVLLVAFTIFSAGLATSYIVDSETFKSLFQIGIGLYTLMLIYCTVSFSKNYSSTLKHLEYVYDEDMYYKLRWVKGCFYSALIVGVVAWFMAVFYNSITINIIGIFLYSIYYLCMVGYFMRYVSDYGFILKSDTVDAARPEIIAAESKPSVPDKNLEKRLEERLGKWVEMKKFRDSNKRVEEIVDELGTTRSALNDYTNSRYGMNFRAWRNLLRIEEAKHLLVESEIPVADIYFVVGFTDRSNFHRQFKEIVGETPMQYRNNRSK